MITKLEDLDDTEHNRRYGKEILRKSLSSPGNQWLLTLNWMISDPSLIPFAATVTFKGLVPIELKDGMKKAASYEYRKWVLNKVRRRLCRSSSKWNKVLPIDYYFAYEYEQGSFFKPTPRSNSPHHVHGIFSVGKAEATRIFNFETLELDPRLKKDIESIATVSSFLIEPLRLEEGEKWARYLLKKKSKLEFLGD